MKKPVSKADIRDKLRRQTERFLRQGGDVNKIPQGASGKDASDPPLFLNRQLFAEPKVTRTPVPEVVAAIESRRRHKHRHKPAVKTKATRPKRKIIYDDFGEPLRKIWLDE